MRQEIQLTQDEKAALVSFRPKPYRVGDTAANVWAFWKSVATQRGLDYTTLISRSGKITALPKGHGQWWCFPEDLKSNYKVRK